MEKQSSNNKKAATATTTTTAPQRLYANAVQLKITYTCVATALLIGAALAGTRKRPPLR